MRRNILKILVLFICFIPFLLNASTYKYNDTLKLINNYINDDNYVNTYNRYLMTNTNFSKCYNDLDDYDQFISGGLLSYKEYNISNINNNSWLSPGLSY